MCIYMHRYPFTTILDINFLSDVLANMFSYSVGFLFIFLMISLAVQWICLLTSDPTSENISKETQNNNSKEHKHPYVHCSIIYNYQDMEAVQVSISRWMDKTIMGHLHNGILLDHKKKKMLPFATVWVDLENIMLSEINQSEKDKYHRVSLICGIYLTTYWTKKQNRDRLIDRE